MKEKSRNIIVGLTVLFALFMLGAMVFVFAGMPEIFQRGYAIRMRSDTTHDVHEGNPVHLSGIRVGQITRVAFENADEPGWGVVFTARIDQDVNIPGNARVFVYTKGFVGASYVEIKPDGQARIDPATGAPMKHLPKDRPVTIEMVHVGSGLLPDELKPALKNLAELAENLNKLIAPPPPSGDARAETAPGAPVPPGLHGTLGKLDRTLDALYAVAGDADNQANIKISLANLKCATAGAVDTMAALKEFAEGATDAMKGFAEASATTQRRIDELATKLIADAEKVSTLMTTINRTAVKIESGDGTVGQLLNDPALYRNLVDATRQMGELMKEFRQLVETWKQHGVSIKVK